MQPDLRFRNSAARIYSLACTAPLTAPKSELHSVQHFPSTGLSKITTFEDPLRKGLFYHLVPPPIPLSDTRSVFAISAISFLSDPPPFSESSMVLCTPYLLFHARLAHRPAHFLPLLHDVISGGLAEAGCGALQLGFIERHKRSRRPIVRTVTRSLV